MKNVFHDVENRENITEQDLLNYIIDYANNSEKIDTEISLEYTLIDNEPVINYKDEKFINAITGGLTDAYKTLYSEMMEKYEKGES